VPPTASIVVAGSPALLIGEFIGLVGLLLSRAFMACPQRVVCCPKPDSFGLVDE